jgi:hypothetical protein
MKENAPLALFVQAHRDGFSGKLFGVVFRRVLF